MRYTIPLSVMLMTCFLSFSQSNFTTKKCKNITNEVIRKNCIMNEIQKFVDENYNISAIAAYANHGKNRIYTRFRIDSVGRITDVLTKGPALQLELEAIRTLQSFPTMIPVRKKGSNTVQQQFLTLLISFEVKATEIGLNEERITDNN